MIELLLQAEGARSAGLLDRAEALYRQVAAADPRNAIAVVGLARVTLERSDEVGALTLARRALAIDPENGSAQRMVQLLEDVLRTRGVSLPAAVAAPMAAVPTSSDGVAEPAAGAHDAANPAVARAEPTDPGRRAYLDRLLRRRHGGQ